MQKLYALYFPICACIHVTPVNIYRDSLATVWLLRFGQTILFQVFSLSLNRLQFHLGITLKDLKQPNRRPLFLSASSSSLSFSLAFFDKSIEKKKFHIHVLFDSGYEKSYAFNNVSIKSVLLELESI